MGKGESGWHVNGTRDHVVSRRDAVQLFLVTTKHEFGRHDQKADAGHVAAKCFMD